METSKRFVAVLMGSDSDLPVMRECLSVLDTFNVPYQAKVTSAHRTPEQTAAYVKQAEREGCAVFICAAGLAAHLAGTVAAHTIKPVIGVPLNGALNGLDALLSTVQMPPGVAVASVAIDKPGAHNAGVLATQILALSDAALAERLRDAKRMMIEKVMAKDQALQQSLRASADVR